MFELIERWKELGFLNDTDSILDCVRLTTMLERVVHYILNTVEDSNLVLPQQADTFIFPCIRRLYTKHGRKFDTIRLYDTLKSFLDNPRTTQLLQDLNAHNVDSQAELLSLFCDEYELECRLKPIKNITPHRLCM